MSDEDIHNLVDVPSDGGDVDGLFREITLRTPGELDKALNDINKDSDLRRLKGSDPESNEPELNRLISMTGAEVAVGDHDGSADKHIAKNTENRRQAERSLLNA